MHTAKINNLRKALKGIRSRMRHVRNYLDANRRKLSPELLLHERELERLDILYAQLTDRFTCLNILNW